MLENNKKETLAELEEQFDAEPIRHFEIDTVPVPIEVMDNEEPLAAMNRMFDSHIPDENKS